MATIFAGHGQVATEPTDATPSIVWDRARLPFDEQYSLSGTATGNLRLPGQYFDSESGLNYNKMRDYDPSRGYIQSDLAGWPATTTAVRNLCYANQNPVRFTDSRGLRQDCTPNNPYGESNLWERIDWDAEKALISAIDFIATFEHLETNEQHNLLSPVFNVTVKEY